MNKGELKKSVLQAIDASRDDILRFGQDIFTHPELGFKENRTAEAAAACFKGLDLTIEEGLALTGVRASLHKKGIKGPTVALLGEMDAVICPQHPHADSATGAAHACGHHIQMAGLVGAAIGLTRSGVAPRLSGNVAFFAVPAEEFIEVEYRMCLKKSGKLEFLGGKPELIRQGYFDGIDMAMMVHAMSREQLRHVVLSGSSNGFIAKRIIFSGKEAHAGGAPDQGINALDAAMLGIMGIHAQRATFKDEDNVRVHPIITHGGDVVSTVPAMVSIETYVRANNIEAIRKTGAKVDRAVKAGADAVGAGVTISTIPGYLPCITNQGLGDIFRDNAMSLVGAESVFPARHEAFSTDMGDVMHLMPGLHAYVGGVSGALHSKDFREEDPEFAYLTSAKLMALTVVDLLADEAEKAREIAKNSTSRMTKDEYLDFLRSMTSEERHIA